MPACPICSAAHHGWQCPEVWALLRAPDMPRIAHIEVNPRTEAERAAQSWANVADETIYVIASGEHYFIADAADRECYHEYAIARGEARVVSVFWPRVPAFAEPALV